MTRLPATTAVAVSSIVPTHTTTAIATTSATTTQPTPSSSHIIHVPSHAIQLRLDLRNTHTVSNNLRYACTKSVLFHILYSRGIVPRPVEELLLRSSSLESSYSSSVGNDPGRNARTAAAAGNGGCMERNKEFLETETGLKPRGYHHQRQRRKQRGIAIRAERRIRKHVIHLRSIVRDLGTLFSVPSTNCSLSCHDRGGGTIQHRVNTDGVRAVCITIGPSFSRPREQYVLRFRSSSSSFPTGDGTPAVATTTTTMMSSGFHRLPHCSNENGCVTTITNNNNDAEAIRIRTEREIGRRSVFEFLRGTSGEEYVPMFERRGGVGEGGCRVHIAALLSKNDVRHLFGSDDSNDDGGTTLASGLETTMMENGVLHPIPLNERVDGSRKGVGVGVGVSGHSCHNQFLVRHGFEVKTPRMRSKRRKLHGPFVVLDVVPGRKRIGKTVVVAGATGSDETEKDVACSRSEGGGEGEGGGGVENRRQDRSKNVGFRMEDGDTWVSLRSFIKGFRE